MKRLALVVLFSSVAASAVAVNAGSPAVADRIAVDALAIERVAEVSQRDLPVALLRRIVNEDIELMRGRRPDGTYEHATWERFEAGRKTESFSVPSGGDAMQTFEIKGAFVYRLILEVPERRMVVRKNVPVWIERVEFDFVADESRSRRETVEIKSWLQPGEYRPVDLPAVARQATARVVATADSKGRYGNLTVSLVEARIVDNADSPWAASVAGAKAALKALDANDVEALRLAARRMAGTVVDRTPRGSPEPGGPVERAEMLELQAELQVIEDLLTGSEGERRDGMDRLHQLIRRLRTK